MVQEQNVLVVMNFTRKRNDTMKEVVMVEEMIDIAAVEVVMTAGRTVGVGTVVVTPLAVMEATKVVVAVTVDQAEGIKVEINIKTIVDKAVDRAVGAVTVSTVILQDTVEVAVITKEVVTVPLDMEIAVMVVQVAMEVTVQLPILMVVTAVMEVIIIMVKVTTSNRPIEMPLVLLEAGDNMGPILPLTTTKINKVVGDQTLPVLGVDITTAVTMEIAGVAVTVEVMAVVVVINIFVYTK